jgi:4-aminobutyrate aminotransferase-like enzyme
MTYRGPFKNNDLDAGEKYARQVEEIVDRLTGGGKSPAGFIAESWPSVAGQMSLPAGYLACVYKTIRAAGGVCIADEVQTAYGRLGEWFWGFEHYDVVPDIVVLGKPIGNGHPLGAVVTTPEIAKSFANGMEFFSTFGGNTVSRHGLLCSMLCVKKICKATLGRLVSYLRGLMNYLAATNSSAMCAAQAYSLVSKWYATENT